jgi:dihydroorotase-like cyclic amidohydrolase
LIAPGFDADLTLVDLDRQVPVTVGTFGGSSDYEVFEGYTLRAQPVLTLLRGRVTARDGQAVGPQGRGRHLRRDVGGPA